MSHTIRISARVMAECEEYLRVNGLYKDGMKLNKMIEVLVSHACYGTADLEDGRKRAAEILAKTEGTGKSLVLRGKLAQFARTADWSGKSGKGSSVPRKVIQMIKETEDMMETEVPLKENLVADEREASHSPKARRLPSPPWEELPKADLDMMARKYPKHLIWNWICEDQLKEIAVSISFAIVPKPLHQTEKVGDLADKLYHSFLEWIEGGDAEEYTKCEVNVIKY